MCVKTTKNNHACSELTQLILMLCSTDGPALVVFLRTLIQQFRQTFKHVQSMTVCVSRQPEL